MLVSAIPAKWQSAFAAGNSALRNVIPVTTGPGTGLASQDLGWQSINAQPPTAGGQAPTVQDFNGILYQSTGWDQWFSMGGAVGYDATFSGNIGGYAAGSVISAASLLGGYWLSQIDNNTSNPDTGGSNWTFQAPRSWGAILTGAGTANAITITLSPAPLSLASLVGNTLKFTVAQANTSAVQISPNILGNLSLVRSDTNPLASGDLGTGIVYQGIFVSTSVVQLINSVASQIAVSAPLNICTDTSGTANAIVASPSPAITYTDGVTVRVHPANANTTAVTANISAQGSIAVTRPDGTACAPNDILTTKYFDAVIKVAPGPITTLQMLSWPQNATGPLDFVSGAAHTYAVADAGKQVERTNSGSPMVDVLPGATAGALPAGWSTVIVNDDPTGLLAITAGPGSGLASATNFGNNVAYLGPGQSMRVYCDGTNYQATNSPARAKMTANVTIQVAPVGSGGSNLNAGITTGSPFLTPTYAYEWAQNVLDIGGFQLTIALAAGTYASGATCNGPLVGQASPVIVSGAGSGSTTISVANAACVQSSNGASVQPQNMTLAASGTPAACLSAGGSGSFIGAYIAIGPGLVFGSCSHYHIQVFNAGSQITLSNGYAITGSAPVHWLAQFGGIINEANVAITITLTGTPAFSTAFAEADTMGLINTQNLMTFSGSATGVRYTISSNGTINTSLSGIAYLPGSLPGTGQTANYF